MQKIIPAILAADPAELKAQLEALRDHSKWVHIDVMDGKFVPNSSVNLFELGEASQFFNLEIHLMVVDPKKYFEDCKGIGAKRVIFHLEGTNDREAVLEKMEKYPFQRGIALNPATAVDDVAPYIGRIHSVLLMSVTPGFQGQEFIPEVLYKIKEVRKLSPDILIGLDGGVKETNVNIVFDGGADYALVGSAITQADDPADAFRRLEGMVQ